MIGWLEIGVSTAMAHVGLLVITAAICFAVGFALAMATAGIDEDGKRREFRGNGLKGREAKLDRALAEDDWDEDGASYLNDGQRHRASDAFMKRRVAGDPDAEDDE